MFDLSMLVVFGVALYVGFMLDKPRERGFAGGVLALVMIAALGVVLNDASWRPSLWQLAGQIGQLLFVAAICVSIPTQLRSSRREPEGRSYPLYLIEVGGKRSFMTFNRAANTLASGPFSETPIALCSLVLNADLSVRDIAPDEISQLQQHAHQAM